jgi:multicomponent Na+:H+ antiporter subunit B
VKVKDFILKRLVLLLLPFIQIYGAFIILYGHVSAGGSFAGGIVVGLAIMIFSTVFGAHRGQEKLPEKATIFAESYGTLWYGLIGLIGIIKGASFLTNKPAGIYLGVPGALISGGIIPLIGLGVGIRVASTVTTLYFAMVEDQS